jgi:hypothetical protein
MQRSWRRGLLAAALVPGLLLGGIEPARAGQDVCAEPNDQPAEACALAPDASVSGYLDTAADVDRYRIQVDQDQTIAATLGNLPGDYGLRLEEADGTLVIEGSGGPERALEALEMPAGAYFLVVDSTSGDADSDAPYRLTVNVHEPQAAPVSPATASAPVVAASAPAPAADRPLDQLVLTLLDAGDKSKASKAREGSVAGAKWHEVTFRRDSDPLVARLGPELIVNRVYRADDEAAAQRIFREQARADYWPEAKEAGRYVGSIGPERLEPGVGQEGQAFGGCTTSDCSPEKADRTYRHFRVTFRAGTLVETIYTYGYESGNYFGVAHDLARRVEQRINSAPAGPTPEIFTERAPQQLSLVIQDAGPQAVEMFRNNGSDDRASWTEVRFERGEETLTLKLGPNTIYNKVFVARSAEQARAIYQENAVRRLPEATQKRGAVFEEDKTKRFGNESYAVGACNDDCGGAESEMLHERLVYRWGNVVVILYTWGREDQSNPESIGAYAATVAGRMP